MLLEVFLLTIMFCPSFVGKKVGGPNLTMGMGIWTAHYSSFILENLHPSILSAQLLCLFHPPIQNGMLYFYTKKMFFNYSSIILVISKVDINGKEMSDWGWKHMTLQVPFAAFTWKSSLSSSVFFSGSGISSSKAGKSFVNTYVDV